MNNFAESLRAQAAEQARAWDVPSLSICVVQDGKTLLCDGIGMRDNASRPADATRGQAPKQGSGNAAKAAGNKSAATAAPKNAPNPAPAPSAKPSRRRKRGGSGNAAGSAAAAAAIAAPAATAEAPQKKWWKRWL